MTLGERIKMLRQKAGLTQEELAKEIGYSTKTSISKIENDVLDINQSTTIALARALKTTPSVIMGWEEVEENISLHYTPQEEALLSNYRQLNSEGQKKVNDYTEDLVKGGLYSNDDDDDEGEEHLIAARTFGKNKDNAIRTIRLKKCKGAGNIFDQPDYKEKL